MPKTERRIAPRRKVEPIIVSSIMSVDHFFNIAKAGSIIEASISGVLLHINRKDLIPKELRENLNIESIEGERVVLHLPQMNIEISGTVTRTKLIGKKGFEIGIDYTEDAPEYWRECLVDLLPSPGEFEDN